MAKSEPNVNVNSQGDWNSDMQSGEIKGAPNAHGVATKNGFVYVADYDNGAIGVGKITDTGIADFSNSHHINLKEDLMTRLNIVQQEKIQGVQESSTSPEFNPPEAHKIDDSTLSRLVCGF